MVVCSDIFVEFLDECSQKEQVNVLASWSAFYVDLEQLPVFDIKGKMQEMNEYLKPEGRGRREYVSREAAVYLEKDSNNLLKRLGKLRTRLLFGSEAKKKDPFDAISDLPFKDLERRYVINALKKNRGNVSAVHRMSG